MSLDDVGHGRRGNQDAAHRVRMGLPKTRRALMSVMHERDDARRKIGFPASAKAPTKLAGRGGTSRRDRWPVPAD